MEQLFDKKNSEFEKMEEKMRTEYDQLKNDMKTVKSNLNIIVPQGVAFNPC